MIGLLGKKVGMSQVFDEQGKQIPVTLLEVGPCYVTDLRTKDKDGYSAVQLGYGARKEKRTSKPRKGQAKKAGATALRWIREIRTENVEGLQLGSQVTVESFEAGDFVDVTGTSLGRGYQGVVKRHGFKGGEKAHGAKFGREAGSTGMSAYPSRIIKGKKMAGQMGNKRVTIQNLKIVEVDKENNLLALRGAVPGFDGSCILVRTALKRGKANAWKVLEAPKKAEEKKPEKAKAKEVPEAEKEVKDEAKKDAGAPEKAVKADAPEKQEKQAEKPAEKGSEKAAQETKEVKPEAEKTAPKQEPQDKTPPDKAKPEDSDKKS